MPLYKLVKGSVRFKDEEGNTLRFEAWNPGNNILDITREQAKILGRRVVPLAEAGEEEPSEDAEISTTTTRRKSRRTAGE